MNTYYGIELSFLLVTVVLFFVCLRYFLTIIYTTTVMTAPLSNTTMMAMKTEMIIILLLSLSVSLSVSLSATVNKRQWHDICMYMVEYHTIMYIILYHAINNESYTYILWKTEEKCVFVV